MLGDLQDMAIADLVQLNCQGNKTACLMINHHSKQGMLYFKGGNVVHAVLDGEDGEESAYKILGWQEGTFDLQPGVEPPTLSITRGWSGLLIEGARRLDEESSISSSFDFIPTLLSVVDTMAQKLDAMLKELSGEIDGYIASNVVGMDGINIAFHTNSKLDIEAVSAQMTMLFKLVDTSVSKTLNGHMEDNVLTTSNIYLYTRYLPDKQYFLGVITDRKTASLGNLRLICKIYVDRIQKIMPRND